MDASRADALAAAPQVGIGGVAPARRRLGLPTKIAYGFGSLAYGIKDNGFSTLLLLFYNQVVGLSAALVGLAIFIALVLDAFIDPLVGYASDRLRTRWGRRHPFMYASAIPVGVLYLLLWNPPVGAPQGVILAYLVCVAILVRTAISCYEVPSAALTPELTSDYHERTSVLGWRYLFGWIGGIGMLMLAFLVFLAPSARFPVGQLNPVGYRHYAVFAAALMTGSILLSAWGTHGEIKRLPPQPRSEDRLSGLARGMLGVLRNRAFAVLLVAGVLSYTVQGLNYALSTYFNTFLWGFGASTLAVFSVCVLVGVGLAFALASAASRRWGKRLAVVGATGAYIVIGAVPLVLRLLGLFPANGDPLLLPLLMLDTVVATAFGVAGAILGQSMIADVVEDDQARTGKRQEGLFFAGSFFMQKCVSGLGLLLSGAILSLVRFPVGATPGHVPAAVITHLILIYVGAMVVLGLTAAAVLSRFPLSEADHNARLDMLAEASLGPTLPGSETGEAAWEAQSAAAASPPP